MDDLFSTIHDLLASGRLGDTAGHLETNAQDMRQLSDDFSAMSSQLEAVSGKFTSDGGYVSGFRWMMLLGLGYLMSLHAVLTACGLMLKQLAEKNV